MPAALPEGVLTDLVLLGLGSSLTRRKYDLRYLSATRLMKMVFAVVERLDLPVTRGWYQFGRFVYGLDAPQDRLLAFVGRTQSDDQSIATIRERVARPSDPIAVVYKRIYPESNRVVEEFGWRPTDDVVREQYSRDAPEPFRNLYQANWDFLELTKGIMGGLGLQTRLVGSLWEEYSETVSSLHIAISAFPEATIRSLVTDYTSLLELLLVKCDSLRPESHEQFSGFLRKVARVYNERVWRYPASWILRETVEGPRREEARRDMNAYLSSLPTFLHEFDEYRNEAAASGFLPTAEEMDKTVERARTRLGGPAARAVGELLAFVGGIEEGSRGGSGP